MDEMSSMMHDVAGSIASDFQDEIKRIELRLLKNHIELMPKVYRKRNTNVSIVQEFLQLGTSQGGRSSSYQKCIELGIDPDGKEI